LKIPWRFISSELPSTLDICPSTFVPFFRFFIHVEFLASKMLFLRR
jgi:hypothetical protein